MPVEQLESTPVGARQRFGVYRKPPRGRKGEFSALVCTVIAGDRRHARRVAAKNGLCLGHNYEAHPMSDEAFRRLWDHEYRGSNT